MASNTKVAGEIDHLLGWVPRAVAALPSVERNWQAAERARVLSPAEIRADQGGFRDEWSDVIAHLRRLHALYERGEMTEQQQQRYRALLALVDEMVSVMERLRLELPPPALPVSSTEARDAEPSPAAR